MVTVEEVQDLMYIALDCLSGETDYCVNDAEGTF